MQFQNLKDFKLPPEFRGKPAWYVQTWWLVQMLLFKSSPQFMYGWRRFLLRSFGAKIGKKVMIRPSAHIQFPWKLNIGDYSWVGDEVVLYSPWQHQYWNSLCCFPKILFMYRQPSSQ